MLETIYATMFPAVDGAVGGGAAPILTADEARQKAAVRIQAFFTGHQARKRLEAVVRIQAFFTRYQTRKRLEAAETRLAADQGHDGAQCNLGLIRSKARETARGLANTIFIEAIGKVKVANAG